ncbi:MAG: hypothetical protein EOP82_03335 [Variovorax sp.]|nr:MAG: hypothetical protein EOP82_03335 [Variovorax sp.]
MSITFNIYGTGASITSAEPKTAAPMAGGASVEIASPQATDAMRTHSHLAADAGQPSTALVQEVEAALLLARAATRDVAAVQQSGIDAGAAPA